MAMIEGRGTSLGAGFSLLLLAGCAQPAHHAALGDASTGPASGNCGPTAAMLPGASEDYQQHPPACELPTAEDLARSCAVHDAVRTPGYRWPEPDETGQMVGGDPLPQYTVEQVACAFTDGHHNRAQCSFVIQRPGDAEPIATSISLTNQFYADNGPAHHIYWAFWQVDGTCLPQG